MFDVTKTAFSFQSFFFHHPTNTSADGYKGVDYSKFTPILIEAIKELNTKHDKDIQQLHAKHTEQLNTLLKRIEALEKK